MTTSRKLFGVLLALALGSGTVALPAHAAQALPDAAARTAPAQHPWSSLTATQHEILAPLQATWEGMPARQQAHMLERAKHWATLAPDQRAAIRQHIAHWQQMTPDERKRARANRRKFHELSAAQREQLHATFERFQQLAPEQRDKLLHEWRALSPSQRLRWTQPAGAGSAATKPPQDPSGNIPHTPPTR